MKFPNYSVEASLRRSVVSFAIVWSLVLLAAGCQAVRSTKVELPHTPPRPVEIEFTGPEEGWPPQPRDIKNIKEVSWQEIPSTLTDVKEAELRKIATNDMRVVKLLGERYAFISAAEIETPKGRSKNEHSGIRVTFFSHKLNTAVEVEMVKTNIAKLRRVPGYYPPEGKEEIEAAIRLALTDSRIPNQARNLEASAILAWPKLGQAGYGNRILHVTFSQAGQDFPEYAAWADLTANK